MLLPFLSPPLFLSQLLLSPTPTLTLVPRAAPTARRLVLRPAIHIGVSMDPVTGPLATLSALSNIPQPDLLTGLGNVGNSLALMMFMMTDQLLLRAAAVMCNLFFVAFFLLQPIDPAPADCLAAHLLGSEIRTPHHITHATHA